MVRAAKWISPAWTKWDLEGQPLKTSFSKSLGFTLPLVVMRLMSKGFCESHCGVDLMARKLFELMTTSLSGARASDARRVVEHKELD